MWQNSGIFTNFKTTCYEFSIYALIKIQGGSIKEQNLVIKMTEMCVECRSTTTTR